MHNIFVTYFKIRVTSCTSCFLCTTENSIAAARWQRIARNSLSAALPHNNCWFVVLLRILRFLLSARKRKEVNKVSWLAMNFPAIRKQFLFLPFRWFYYVGWVGWKFISSFCSLLSIYCSLCLNSLRWRNDERIRFFFIICWRGASFRRPWARTHKTSFGNFTRISVDRICSCKACRWDTESHLPSRKRIWTLCQVSTRMASSPTQYKSVHQIVENISWTVFTYTCLFSIHSIFNKSGALNALQLTITKLQESDSGKYRCVARGERLTQLQHSVDISILPSKKCLLFIIISVHSFLKCIFLLYHREGNLWW